MLVLRQICYFSGFLARNAIIRFSTSRSVVDNHSGMLLKEFVLKFQEFAPSELAEDWDNVGLLVEPCGNIQVNKMMITNDLTEPVMDEAILKKINLIIAYHPPIFRPFKMITQNTWKERILAKCLANNIAIYSPHTALDAIGVGINDWLLSCLQFHRETYEPIVKSKFEHGSVPVGMGRIGRLQTPTSIEQIIEKMKDHLKLSHLRLALACHHTLESKIQQIGCCAGSGASLLNNSSQTLELYITGEMSHHEVLDACHRGISVILCEHSNTERGYLSTSFLVYLRTMFPNTELLVSERDQEPLKIV